MADFSSCAGVFVAALVLIGYFGQKYWPAPKPKVFGIDLGTTYSCAAFHSRLNEYELVKAQRDRDCIPSVVAYYTTSQGAPRTLVGYDALDVMGDADADVIYDAKRFIGRVFDAASLADECRHYRFAVVLNDTGHAFFRLRDGSVRSPEQVGSEIVRALKAAAEAKVGGPMTACVVSVPAEFSAHQRRATEQCAKDAGLTVWRVINEPTAAALAYGLHERTTDAEMNVLVVDVGGGTTDISLMRVERSMFLTIAMAGHRRLGGQDFTENLMGQVGSRGAWADEDALRRECERCKRELSTAHECVIGDAAAAAVVVSREAFEDANEGLFARVFEPVDAVLGFANMTERDVSEVVLVGGSSRIPRLRAMISARFGGRAPNHHLHPDTTVVRGLAIQAAVMAQQTWPVRVGATEVDAAVTRIEL